MSQDIERLVTRNELDADMAIVDFVAGRMQPAELRAFEERLSVDPELREAVNSERALHAALSAGHDQGVPAASGFEKLRGELTPTAKPRRLPYAVAATAIIGLAGLLVTQQIPEVPPDFQGLSSDPVSIVENGSNVRVVFSSQADSETRRAVAERLGFEIVSGPGPASAYVVRPISDGAPPDLDSWLDDPHVRLAERIGYQP